MLPTIASIARKWSAAGDRGRDIRLEAAELDLLNAAGAGEFIATASAAELRQLATDRIAARQAR